MKFRLFTRENLWALILCIIMVIMVVATAGSSPMWIYQGF